MSAGVGFGNGSDLSFEIIINGSTVFKLDLSNCREGQVCVNEVRTLSVHPISLYKITRQSFYWNREWRTVIRSTLDVQVQPVIHDSFSSLPVSPFRPLCLQ